MNMNNIAKISFVLMLSLFVQAGYADEDFSAAEGPEIESLLIQHDKEHQAALWEVTRNNIVRVTEIVLVGLITGSIVLWHSHGERSLRARMFALRARIFLARIYTVYAVLRDHFRWQEIQNHMTQGLNAGIDEVTQNMLANAGAA